MLYWKRKKTVQLLVVANCKNMKMLALVKSYFFSVTAGIYILIHSRSIIFYLFYSELLLVKFKFVKYQSSCWKIKSNNIVKCIFNVIQKTHIIYIILWDAYRESFAFVKYTLFLRRIYIIVIIDMSVLPSRWTNCFRSELARNRSSPARLRGGWGLAGAGAGVP